VFKRIDTSGWSPMVLQYVQMSALTGERLPSGVYSMLKQVWLNQGQPNGDFDSWLWTQVYPSIKGEMLQGMIQ
jgi:hypothetical protein